MKTHSYILLILLCFQAAHARHPVEQKLTELRELANAPGINFSIILPTGLQTDYSEGYADLAGREKMTPDHSMFSGSIGKTYAVAVIAQLVDEGRIDLNRRFIEYFPETKWLRELPNSGEFTVLQLMQHRSGLPRYAFKKGVWETVREDPGKVWSYKDRLSFVLGDSAVHAAGKGFSYSDTGYLLLGMLVEKVTGKYYYDAIRERILVPMGLHQTYAADTRSFPNGANTYSRDEVFGMPGPVFANGVCRFNPQMENAGGGFVNTAADLAKWAKLYYEGAPFSDSMRSIIQEISPDGENLYDGWHCGAGIFILETNYGRAYGHTGLMVGTRSVMLHFPDHNMTAALQMNTDKPDGGSELLDMLEQLIDVALNNEILNKK